MQFAPENWFVTDRASAYFQEKSNYFIQALEPSKVILLDETFMLHLAQQSNSFVEFNNKLLHNHIRQFQNLSRYIIARTTNNGGFLLGHHARKFEQNKKRLGRKAFQKMSSYHRSMCRVQIRRNFAL